MWESVAQKQMEEIIITALSSVEDIVESRRNSFELFGFDFMVDSNLKLWLIEINSSPDLSHSTAVTAQLVKCMLEDLLKVVIDRKVNRKCDTG